MSTRAYEDFQRTIARVRSLLDIHATITKEPGRPPLWASDILRATLVFIMASLDSYIHDVVQENVYAVIQRRRGKNLPREMLQVLKDAVPYEKALEMLYQKRAAAIVSASIRKRNAERSFMKPEKMEQAMQTLGITNIWGDVASKWHRRRDGLVKKFKEYAVRRDKIAHEGDTGKATRYKGKIRSIKRPYVEKVLADVEKLVELIDGLVLQARG